MKQIKFIAITLALIIFAKLSGQNNSEICTNYPSGVSLKYGLGNYSQIDEYISSEKYSGQLPFYSLSWVRNHQRYVYKLEMDYRYSSEISNYNVSAAITQGSMNQGFLYPLKKRTLLNRDFHLWIGPAFDLFFFFNKPKIAVSGFDYAQSFALLLSAAINADMILKLNPKFQLESSLKLTVLSLGMRMVDSEEDDASPVELLTLFSGLSSSCDFGIRYLLFDKVSIKLAYLSEIARITAWEPLLSVSDNITIGLTYKF